MKLLSNQWFYMFLALLVPVLAYITLEKGKESINPANKKTYDSTTNIWHAPSIENLPDNEQSNLIRYGEDLISNTAYYLGPKGKIAPLSNGMNCENCHRDAGTKLYGNCFSAVASFYPGFRPRSGIVETIEFRINDCMKRSLNGNPLDSNSKEMKAMVAYLQWLGKDVPKGVKPFGANSEELPYPQRAADTAKGKLVFLDKCQRCHGADGSGQLNAAGYGFLYPPLWGSNSYNTGAGLYRLSRFAGYIKNNMPFGSTYDNPELTTEEAWDVAAYVNSQPRPVKIFTEDWPDISKKAIDYPFGPYTDSFSEQQHKYGPFLPIKKARDEVGKKNAGSF